MLLLAILGWGCAHRPDANVVHVMQRGETLYRISRYYGVPVQDIVRANRIADVSNIPTGARLLIPGARRQPPKHSIALASYVPHAPEPGGSAQPEISLDFAWPVRGKLSSRFGWRSGKPHEGIDISARPGAEVRAAEAGRVIVSGRLGGYGRVVIVKHAGHYSTVYAHNSKNRVEKGAFVEKGDVIAEVGRSGNASGPHLHFEIRRRRQPQDPLRYLR
ncbi:MAG TPA: LysM peptidoglycan-binding domain-containing M23 family metallopeptidase [Myxococcota bacterium]